eukprot:gene10316-2732_t
MEKDEVTFELLKIKNFQEINFESDYSSGQISPCKKYFSLKNDNFVEIFSMNKKIEFLIKLEKIIRFGWLYLKSEKTSILYTLNEDLDINFLNFESIKNELFNIEIIKNKIFSHQIQNILLLKIDQDFKSIVDSLSFENCLILNLNKKIHVIKLTMDSMLNQNFLEIEEENILCFGVLDNSLIVIKQNFHFKKYEIESLKCTEEIQLKIKFQQIIFLNDFYLIKMNDDLLIKLTEEELKKIENIEENENFVDKFSDLSNLKSENKVVFIQGINSIFDFSTINRLEIICFLELNHKIYQLKNDGIYKLSDSKHENTEKLNEIISTESNLKDVIVEVLLEGYSINHLEEFIKFNESEEYFNQLNQQYFSIIYESFLTNDFDIGITMIENLNENVDEYLKSVIFNTPNSTIRRILIKELKRRNSFNKQEEKLIDFLFELEEHYDEIYFSKYHKTSEYLKTGDLNDFGELITKEFDHSDDSDFEEDHNGFYLYTTLDWIKNWTRETKERILIEISKEEEVEKKFDKLSKFSYYVSHFEYKKLISLINKHPELLKQPLYSSSLKYIIGYEFKLNNEYRPIYDKNPYLYDLTHKNNDISNRPEIQQEIWMKFLDCSNTNLMELSLLNCELISSTRDLNKFYDRPLIILSTMATSNNYKEILNQLDTEKFYESISKYPHLKRELKQEIDITIEDFFPKMDDEEDIEYLLKRDQPMKAFELIKSRYMTSINISYELKEEPFCMKYMNEEERNEIQNEIKEISVNEINDDFLISSCKTFLELCGFETDLFLIETKLIKIIQEKYQLKVKTSIEIFETISKFYDDQQLPLDLISLFLKHHQEFKFEKHLISIAKNQDWKTLLNQNFFKLSDKELYSLVEDHFQNDEMKENLLFFLNTENDKLIIYNCLKYSQKLKSKKESSKYLLQKSYEHKIPLLSVLAADFDEKNRLKCFIVYLYIFLQNEDLEIKNEIEDMLEDKTNQIFENLLFENIILKFILDEKLLMHLINGFKIFDDDSSLLDLIHNSHELLKKFFNEKNETLKKFGETLIFKFGMEIENYYERTQYLDILNDFKHLKNLHQVNKILVEKEIYDLNVFLETNEHIIQILIDYNSFNEVKELVELFRLSKNEISIEIGNKMIKSIKEENPDKEYILNEIDSIFASYDTYSDLCGNFFILKSIEYQDDFNLNQIIKMIKLSSHWFKKMDSRKLESDLEFIENCITILSTCKNKIEIGNVLNSIKERIIMNNKKQVELDISNIVPLSLDELLNKENLRDCERLSNYFNYNSIDLQLVKTANLIAKNEIKKEEIPENISIMLKGYLEVFDDTKMILEKIASLCTFSGGKKFCRIISLLYQISIILETSYEIVYSETDKIILEKLFNLGVKKNSRIISKYILLRDVEDFESIFSFWIFKSIKSSFENSTHLNKNSNEKTSQDNEEEKWTSRSEFVNDYLTLCHDSNKLGCDLLFFIEKKFKCPIECEIEMIIRSFWCFQISSNLDGMKKCHQFIKENLFDQLMKDNISLLVHLLVSIKDYENLCSIFDNLLKTNQFEIIEQQRDQVQLKMGISYYLKTKKFQDEKQLRMVYTKYEMWTNLGEYLLKKGNLGVSKLFEQMRNGTIGYFYSLRTLIHKTSNYFKDASDAFINDERYQTASQCLNLAVLVKLQENITGYCILNISQNNAKIVMNEQTDFQNALIIASAYHLNVLSEWISPLYKHVILNGRIKYFNEFRQSLPTPEILYLEITKIFIQDEKQHSYYTKKYLKDFISSCSNYKIQAEAYKMLNWKQELEIAKAFIDE